VFGVMLTSHGPRNTMRTTPIEWVVGIALASAIFALLVTVSLDLGRSRPPVPGLPDAALPGPGPLGEAFLGVPETPGGLAFLLPFEVVSVHLLVVLVAAAYLARAKRRAGGE
ncbi:MAG: NADH-quinone oxidoreductase subunit J, partial [Fimbriiglobus sp.]